MPVPKLSSRFLVGGIALLSIFSLASKCEAVSKSYVGLSGGVWENASNWNPSGVPTSADDVFVTSTNSITVTASVGQTINFNSLTLASSTFVLNGDIGTGGNITIGLSGTLVQGNDHLQKISGNLVANSGNGLISPLLHTSLSLTSGTPFINFEANNITFVTSTLINLDGLGYPGGAINQDGYGPSAGKGDAAGAGGGANCGNGGNGAVGIGGAAGGAASIFSSRFNHGSGGGGDSSGTGGAGGGKIKLFARNTFTQNATIRAQGASQAIGGGGAGGSIWLLAKNYISGSGSLGVAGNSADNTSGAGGGGCIRLEYFASSTRGEMTPNTDFFTGGGSGGVNPGTHGDYHVYKGPAPVANFAVATGTSPYSTLQLSWTWGGGDFDWFYNIEKSLDGADYSLLTSTPNTSTLAFIDTSLMPATKYWYRVNTVSSTVPLFVLVSGTAASIPIPESVYQYAEHVILPQPLSATFGALQPTSLPVTLNYGLNPGTTPLLVSDDAGYYYTAGGVRNGTSPSYITVADWQGSLSSLTASTTYAFTFTPYVLVDTSTYYAATSSLTFTTTTPLAAPSTPTFMGETSTTVNLVWATNGNPTSTPYAVYNVTLDKYHTATGSISATPVFFPVSSWTGAAKELSPATAYTFKVVLRNENGTQNVTTSAAGASTLNANNLPISTGGVPVGATTSTGSGSGWYYGTPGSVITTSPNSNLPTSTIITSTSLSGYLAPGISADGMSAYIDGVLVTPQSVFQMFNSTPSGSGSGYSSISTFSPKNANSSITFSKLPPVGTTLTIPKSLSFTYTYRNPGISRTIFVERVLLSPQGKVLSRSTASRILNSKQTATYLPTASLASTLPIAGTYTIRVRVYASNRTTVLDENSFDLLLKK